MFIRNYSRTKYIACLAMLLVSSISLAADKPAQKLTAVSRDQVDTDFAFQGEYEGLVFTSGNKQGMKIGLQVIAQGDGAFRVLELMGGLPGSGWNRTQKIYLTGKLQGSTVLVEANPVNVILKDGKAVIGNSWSETYGTLKKVERTSPTLGMQPPPDALVLFDGTNTSQFKTGKMTKDNLLTEGAETLKPVGSFRLHAEFRLPYKPHARGQARGNSGFYLQRRYEVQVLDSFGLESQHNDCGALYKTKVPDINMCFPPLQWQTYDINFEAAQFDVDGKKTRNAIVTVRHNGVIIHNQFEIPNKTGGGKPESSEPLPILLQNHSNPVRFRNIWLVEYQPGENPELPQALPASPLQECYPIYPCEICH